VDTIGIIIARKERGTHFELTIQIPKEWIQYVVEKGSIAVDGVSLTVNQCFENNFTVNIIPHTAQVTILGKRKIGDKVNIETDLIGKYVAKLLAIREEKKLNENFLKEYGFW